MSRKLVSHIKYSVIESFVHCVCQSLTDCEAREAVAHPHCMYRCEGEDLSAAFVSLHFVSFRTGRFASYCIFVYSCEIVVMPIRLSVSRHVRSSVLPMRLIIAHSFRHFCRGIVTDSDHYLRLPMKEVGCLKIYCVYFICVYKSAASWARALHYRFMRCVDVSLMCI
eukprot:scaffold195811_cov23-Cyclotella_meneghiniana.AAC.1